MRFGRLRVPPPVCERIRHLTWRTTIRSLADRCFGYEGNSLGPYWSVKLNYLRLVVHEAPYASHEEAAAMEVMYLESLQRMVRIWRIGGVYHVRAVVKTNRRPLYAKV